MARSEGFPSQTVWLSGGAKPVKENVMSKKRKREVERNKKLVQYEKALQEEAKEKKARELFIKSQLKKNN